jgi:peptidoglycan-associated lipoprotein
MLAAAILLSGCSYIIKVKDGPAAVEVKQYAVAVDLLEKEFRKAKTRVEKGRIAYLLARSYDELFRTEAALNWYRTAYDHGVGVDALRGQAYALKRAERYAEAIQAFKELGIEIGSPYEYRREINACEVAQGWKNIKYPEYSIELLWFNSGYADYSPQVFRENQLVFTSDRKAAEKVDIYNWTGNPFSNLYVVDLASNKIDAFDQRINTGNNEGTAAFNKNYTEVYFTRCFGVKREDAHCKLMVSERRGEGWSEPRVLDFVAPNVNYGHPSLSANGKELFFSCNHPDGWGGYDIWMSQRTIDGWGPPELLGRGVNTPGDEKFPFIDGDTLYFSSDWHTGMGGLDIFRSYKLSNGAWSPAYNLLPPINSGADDFGFVIDHRAKKAPGVLQAGYFSSKRSDGLGNDDIYRFEKRIPPEPQEEEIVEKPKEIEYKLLLEGYVLEKIFADPSNPNSRVLGRRPIPGAKVQSVIGDQTRVFTVDEEGFFSMELAENTDYVFLGSKENYLNNQTTFSTKGVGRDPNRPVQIFELEIVLDKIFLNKEIVLENIYYDFDKWNIRDDAKPTLDALTRNLQLNPGIRIQLGSHTDCRGSNAYNLTLSQRRAQSAVDYLITKGIDPDRLQARGYGENQPAVDCPCARCTEDEHQMNRRTTFAIVE